MSKKIKYNDVMENLTMTPEMENRILENLKKAEAESHTEKPEIKSNTVHFRRWIASLSAAAAAFVVIIGSVTANNLTSRIAPEPSSETATNDSTANDASNSDTSLSSTGGFSSSNNGSETQCEGNGSTDISSETDNNGSKTNNGSDSNSSKTGNDSNASKSGNNGSKDNDNSDTAVSGNNGSETDTDMSSLSALKKTAGFDITEPVLPFEVGETKYMMLHDGIAEIDYTSKEQTSALYFDQSDDEKAVIARFSGQFSGYDTALDFTINNATVTAYGSSDGYMMVKVTDGSYYYVLTATAPYSLDEWKNITAPICN